MHNYFQNGLVQLLATGRTVQGSNPGSGEIFRTRPDRPCGPHSLIHNGPTAKVAKAWR